MTTIARPSRALFRFSGPEAQKLLNDVVTCTIAAEPGPARWFALLSPQGKVQAEGLAGFADGAFWLDVDAGVADEFFRKMRMYRLRAQVVIDDLRQTHRVGWSPDGNANGIVEIDSRGPGLGARVIGDAAEASTWMPADVQHAAARIALGISELGPDFAADSVFPHDIGMDLLEGVDFKKGCYVGQEVVSRMQHRGTARRRPVIVSGVSSGPLMVGEREVGTVGEVANGAAVGIVRIDRIDDPAAVTAAGQPVTIALPPWASYRFGESPVAE
jgi:folate-binding protein YgfZ